MLCHVAPPDGILEADIAIVAYEGAYVGDFFTINEVLLNSFLIEDNDNLTSLAGFETVATINGDLTISNNTQLNVLDGLTNATTCLFASQLQGRLDVTNNTGTAEHDTISSEHT